MVRVNLAQPDASGRTVAFLHAGVLTLVFATASSSLLKVTRMTAKCSSSGNRSWVLTVPLANYTRVK